LGEPFWGLVVWCSGCRLWGRWWWALVGERIVLGGLVVAALGVASAGVMQVGALMVGWCWRAGRGTDRWWRDW
jgi:hypothetical protein